MLSFYSDKFELTQHTQVVAQTGEIAQQEKPKRKNCILLLCQQHINVYTAPITNLGQKLAKTNKLERAL